MLDRTKSPWNIKNYKKNFFRMADIKKKTMLREESTRLKSA